MKEKTYEAVSFSINQVAKDFFFSFQKTPQIEPRTKGDDRRLSIVSLAKTKKMIHK
jgi:hypothetical protein